MVHVAITFLCVAIPSIRVFRNLLSWFIYAGGTTMFVFLPCLFNNPLSWEPSIVFGAIALLAGMQLFNKYLPGGGKSFDSTRKVLGLQIILYWFIAVAHYYFPPILEIYKVLAYPLVPVTAIMFLVRRSDTSANSTHYYYLSD